MEQKAHSRLSASGSSQWLACPGSVKLSEKAPPKVTHPSAQVGTVAHYVCEVGLDRLLDKSDASFQDMLGEEINGIFVDRPMIIGAEIYVNFIADLYDKSVDKIEVETRLTLEHIHPDMFGTADCVLIKANGHVHVIDYKFGTFPVKAKENSQMIYYALGAIKKMDTTPTACTITIIQPRSSDGEQIKSWDFPKDQFEVWEKKFKTASEMADIGTPLVKGKHCQFCQAKPICTLHNK
jgi:CRISPR/Cas system-associated exonuclease Cas4 (RecB family)